ncbi:MAG TPA: M23 family metallopeptidase [Bdellovibrionales bacterium]|nr:M23 family metallopeptidase [Bdellovibrionales bacterium]
MRYVLLSALVLLFAGCGTYRSGSGGYRTGGDYAVDGNGEYYLSRRAPLAEYVPSAEFRLYWPVRQVKMNRGFRPASDPNHQGIDLGGSRGTPILAGHEGLVVYVGQEFSGYGKMVLIEYDKEWASIYAHLDSISVREGQIVKPGDPVGTMGKTGRASGVHLHFEVLKSRKNVDPLPLLGRGSQLARKI